MPYALRILLYYINELPHKHFFHLFVPGYSLSSSVGSTYIPPGPYTHPDDIVRRLRQLMESSSPATSTSSEYMVPYKSDDTFKIDDITLSEETSTACITNAIDAAIYDTVADSPYTMSSENDIRTHTGNIPIPVSNCTHMERQYSDTSTETDSPNAIIPLVENDPITLEQ